MCYNPISIVNKSRYFDPNKDKPIISVPCHHCGECRSELQKQFEARCYFEYLKTSKLGGFTFFDTFTYDQESVPVYKGFLTFDARHYKRFMDHLRDALERDGYKPVERYDPYTIIDRHGKTKQMYKYHEHLKVFWSSEYGGETHRPHYHALFFVTFDITPEAFNKYCSEAWYEFRKNSKGKRVKKILGRNDRRWCEWHMENGVWSPPSGIQSKIVNAQGAVAYVSKYVTKDCDYEEVFKDQKYSFPENLTSDDEIKEFYRRIAPFHRQSNGLGESIKEFVPMDLLEAGQLPLYSSDKDDLFQLNDGTTIPYKMIKSPLYIERKLFYDYYPEDKSFHLSDYGNEVMKDRLLQNIRYAKENFESWYISLPLQFTDDMLRKLNIHHKNLRSKQDLLDYIDYRKGNYSFEDIAVYSTVYYNRCDLHFALIESLDPGELLSRYESLIVEKYSKHSYDTWDVLTSKTAMSLLHECGFDYRLPQFNDLKYLIKIYNETQLLIKSEQQRCYEIERRSKSKYKQLYSKLVC